MCGGSEAKGAFTPVDNTPLHFRTDGVPLNPCRLPGRPLMASPLCVLRGACQAPNTFDAQPPHSPARMFYG